MFQKLKTKLGRGWHWALQSKWSLLLVALAAAVVSFLLLHRLTTLPTGGLSPAEQGLAAMPIGWHGLFQDPFFLINKLQLSVSYYLFGQGGAAIVRLPSVKLGAIAIICVGILLRVWHGTRIAVLGCLLFTCSAWTLHVSRYASWDSTYLAVLPLLLVSQLALQRLTKVWVPYVVVTLWSLLLFTPGFIWFALFAFWWERPRFVSTWQQQEQWWQRLLLLILGFAWLPLLASFFIRQPGQIAQWLGAPAHFDSLLTISHRLASVPLHLFGYGPAIPELWLGRLPLLDIFTLTITILGLIFYAQHWRSGRSRLLLAYAALGTILIGGAGATSLSLLVPLCYLAAAAGLSYLLRNWLRRFPLNPILRSVGVVGLSLLVLASCAYNLQSYFVAWPHNQTTISHFRSQP